MNFLDPELVFCYIITAISFILFIFGYVIPKIKKANREEERKEQMLANSGRRYYYREDE